MSMLSASSRRRRSGRATRSSSRSSGARSSRPRPERAAMKREVPIPPRWRRWGAAAMKLLLASILTLAILDMLAGVVLRYVVVRITDYFDWPGVSFFWVEEVGEF